jgi:hypothetical protein
MFVPDESQATYLNFMGLINNDSIPRIGIQLLLKKTIFRGK